VVISERTLAKSLFWTREETNADSILSDVEKCNIRIRD
jgi:hypothetical protein